MAKPEYTDNYAAAIRAVAAFVLDNAPRGMRPRSRAELERKLSGEEAVGYDCFYVEFTRGNRGDATLYVRFEADERVTDSVGDVWRKHKVSTQVNWSCCGSQAPGIATVFAAMLADVSAFAIEVDAGFGTQDIYSLVATKAQRDEERRVWAADKARADVMAALRVGSRGMRPHTDRTVVSAGDDPAGEPHGLVVGRYDGLEIDGRIYNVVVNDDRMYRILRIDPRPKKSATTGDDEAEGG